MNDNYNKALKLYQNAKIFFIGSIDTADFPNIKAVLVADKKANLAEIVIKTNTSSQHVQQFRNIPMDVYTFTVYLALRAHY